MSRPQGEFEFQSREAYIVWRKEEGIAQFRYSPTNMLDENFAVPLQVILWALEQGSLAFDHEYRVVLVGELTLREITAAFWVQRRIEIALRFGKAGSR